MCGFDAFTRYLIVREREGVSIRLVIRNEGRTYVRVTWLRARHPAVSHSRAGRSYLAAVRELQLAAGRLRAAGAYPGGSDQVEAFRQVRSAWLAVVLSRHRLQR
ncbi:hypothetical protein GCM10009661_00570 [Catellatospora chokoriensis]|uniref:Uncharacterized protein n=1 Tax=Catellatospora chokoriensis TaxID=310353 RepID=A0A8J3K855_9ACTN|nr:hypothetical protein Cch02nite_53670 [Catellatospora chokoriensis]